MDPNFCLKDGKVNLGQIDLVQFFTLNMNMMSQANGNSKGDQF